MPLNRDLIDAARNLPHEPEPAPSPALSYTVDRDGHGDEPSYIDPRRPDFEAILTAHLDSQTRLSLEFGNETWQCVFRHFWRERELETGRVVATIATHLPGLAPAVIALAEHALYEETVYQSCCGLPALQDGPTMAGGAQSVRPGRPPMPRPSLDSLDRRRDAIRARLSPAVWEEVGALITLDHWYTAQRYAEIIATHLPGVEPAVLALLEHAANDDPRTAVAGCPSGCTGNPTTTTEPRHTLSSGAAGRARCPALLQWRRENPVRRPLGCRPRVFTSTACPKEGTAMHRLSVIAGAVGLLVATSLPAVAAKPTRPSIGDLGAPGAAGVCPAEPGSDKLGQVQVNQRGKSGGAAATNYKFQVKLTDGEAANTYDVLLYAAGSDCSLSLLESTPVLKTNSKGKGVKNVKYSVPAGGQELVVVLRDTAIGADETQGNDLGTAPFSLGTP
jgi:hypothetical protein